MDIVVLVKQVPDSGLERNLGADNRVERAGSNNVMGELDEYAVEAALQLRETGDNADATVTVLTVGPDHATETIRKVLAMGVDKAVHVCDDAIAGSDALATANIISAALGRMEWDLVIAGAESTDSGMGVMPHLLGAQSGAAVLTGARNFAIDAGNIIVTHQRDNGSSTLKAALPAIVSVWDTINTPRYPSLKGIMGAKRKKIETLSLSDLGIDAAQAGSANAKTEVVSVAARPERAAGTIVTDEGAGGTGLAEFLATEKFV